jgi:hypothetical protein
MLRERIPKRMAEPRIHSELDKLLLTLRALEQTPKSMRKGKPKGLQMTRVYMNIRHQIL